MKFLAKYCVVAAAFFFVLLSPAVGREENTVLLEGKTRGEINLQKKIWVLEDKTGALTIESILEEKYQKRFRLNHEGKTSYGYSSSAFWLKVRIVRKETGPRRWFLKILFSHTDRIDFFTLKNDGSFSRITTGDSFSFKQRYLKNRYFIFPVTPGDEGADYYLRLESLGLMSFPVVLSDAMNLYESDHGDQLYSGIYFGLFLIIIILNVFLAASIRERLYLYFALHVFFILIYEVTSMGVGFEYLWSDYPFINSKIDMFSSALLFLFLGLFIIEAFNFKKNSLFFYRILLGTTVMMGLYAIATLLLERKYVLAPGNASTVLIVAAVMSANIFAWIRHLPGAKLLLIAWLMPLGGAALVSLSKMDLLPAYFQGTASIKVGLILNTSLVSLGLAERINRMKKSIEQKRVTLKSKNEELQATNEELMAANEEFEAQNEELINAFHKIEQSEHRFREFTELLPQTVVENDLDERIVYSNKKGFEMTGYSSRDIEEGIYIKQFFEPGAYDYYKKNMMRLTDEKSIVPNEYNLLRKDGSLVPVIAFSMVIYEDSKPVGFRTVVLDISERKKTEELILQSEKMMTVSSLSAGMAHEINNPLGIILQGIQNARRRLNPGTAKNMKAAEKHNINLESLRAFLDEQGINRYMEGIEEAGRRAGTIVSSMLDFSRRSDAVMEKMHCEEILDSALDLAGKDYDLKKKYDFRHIDITRDYRASAFVSAVRSELEQVFINLFRNAAQAMFDIEKEDYHPELVLLTENNNSMITIRISDNGPGMDEETRKKIFEPFFTTKKAGRGTGLGLSVSYFIITGKHDGTIRAESEPGKGTTFVIELPALKQGGE